MLIRYDSYINRLHFSAKLLNLRIILQTGGKANIARILLSLFVKVLSDIEKVFLTSFVPDIHR